ncbi:MAG: LD-carboxypeptidase [Candidatus Aenigmatarchaeota archaeon]
MPQFGEYPQILEYTLEHFKKVIMNPTPTFSIVASKRWTDEFLDWSKGLDNRPRKMKINKGWEVLKPGEAKGKLVGGDLTTLETLIGTEYLPTFKNSLFFWEAIETSTAEIDRSLTHLKLSGIFDQINGMIVGRLARDVKISDKNNSLEKIILDLTEEYDFPIMTELDFGHTDPMMTIPIGIKSLMLTSERKLILQGQAVI